MQSKNLDALFVSTQNNVLYLTGFSGLAPNEREGFLMITPENAYLLTFPTYFGLFKRRNKNIKSLCITPEKKLTDILNEIISDENIKNIGYESENLTLSEFNSLTSNVKKRWVSTTKIIENLRIIKTADELKKIRKAADITDKTFHDILKIIREGITEKDLSVELEYLLKKNGDEIAFPPIVAFGKNASIPHYMPSSLVKLRNRNPVLMDFGAKYEGYCADMTRVVFFGQPDKEIRRVYEIVHGAQIKAIEILKAGLTGHSVDIAARNYIKSEGFNPYPHGLGHGVGLDIHEDPRLKINNNNILPIDSVVTVEPGIYIPDKIGIRIEDMVILKEHTNEDITETTHEIKIL